MLLLRIVTVIVQIYAFLWVASHLVDIDGRTNSLITLAAIVAHIVNGVFFAYMNFGLYGKYFVIIVPLLVNIFVMCFFYVQTMREKDTKMKNINRNLTEKITELQKLKHDYGSEISGLYGLYKLGEYKRLEKMLKDIINRYESIDSNLEMNFEASPIVKSLFSSINDNNVEIEIQDEGYYENIALSESELYKILSNITKNAMEALEGVEGSLIKYKSYNGYKKLVIEIENIGQDVPMITEEALNNIYNPGYSTKDTQEERGYGLAIVKELMDKVGGRIFIESKKNITLFKLEIPRRE